MTPGGQFNAEECHPSHKLTKQDVINIRSRYNNHERKNKVYEDYKDLIGESGFHKIWNGENIRKVYKDYSNKITYGSFTNVWTY